MYTFHINITSWDFLNVKLNCWSPMLLTNPETSKLQGKQGNGFFWSRDQALIAYSFNTLIKMLSLAALYEVKKSTQKNVKGTTKYEAGEGYSQKNREIDTLQFVVTCTKVFLKVLTRFMTLLCLWHIKHVRSESWIDQSGNSLQKQPSLLSPRH